MVDPLRPTDSELNKINQKLDRISKNLAKNLAYSEISEHVNLLNRPGKLIARNLLAGVARGVGIAIGFTVFLMMLLYFLKALGALDLPIIGDYIADIVKIVQAQLEGRTY